MRAVFFPHPGPEDVLQVTERPTPEPQPGEVLVRVRAAGVNRADLLQRRGRYPAPDGAPPDVPGLEFAGEVAALGPGVSEWSVGDRVFGITAGGAYAELLRAHAGSIAAIPESLDWVQAAAVPEAFVTAYDALVTQGGLRRGERVVITAVGSGVGLAAVQVTLTMGGQPFGTTRSADKLERARAVGLEHGHVCDSGPEGLADAVRAWSGGAGTGADLVLDLVGGPYVPAAIDALGRRGRIMLVGLVGGSRAEVDLGLVLSKRLTIRGTVLRSRPIAEKIAVMRAFATHVVPLLADGRLRPIVDATFPLEMAAEAHRLVESNGTFGKVVLEVG